MLDRMNVSSSPRRRIALAAVMALLLAVVAAACAESPEESSESSMDAADWEPVYEDGVLQPLPDGFPDDEITFVNVDEAGSRDGIYGRTLDEALQDISPVDIVVSDEPSVQGGSIAAMVDTLSRAGGPDGYWPVLGSITGAASDFHIEPLEDELGVSIEDINFFIATEVHAYALAQRKDAPWGVSFGGFVDYVRDHPGEVKYISPGVGSGQDIFMEWLLDQLDLEVEKIPAAEHEQAIAAVGAGAGDVTMNRPELVWAAEQQDRMDTIMLTTEELPAQWADNPGAISAKDFPTYDLPTEVAWGAVEGFFVPREVPELHVRWLYELIHAATETETYQDREGTVVGMRFNIVSSREANEIARTAYEVTEPIVRAVGLHHEDN